VTLQVRCGVPKAEALNWRSWRCMFCRVVRSITGDSQKHLVIPAQLPHLHCHLRPPLGLGSQPANSASLGWDRCGSSPGWPFCN
jgi:hypothetical protein